MIIETLKSVKTNIYPMTGMTFIHLGDGVHDDGMPVEERLSSWYIELTVGDAYKILQIGEQLGRETFIMIKRKMNQI